MTDVEKIERALELMKEAAKLVARVEAGENVHLQVYALGGLCDDTRDYLEILRRRLIHTSGAECPPWYED